MLVGVFRVGGRLGDFRSLFLGGGVSAPAAVLGIVAVFAQHQVKIQLLRAHADIGGVGNTVNLAVEQGVHVENYFLGVTLQFSPHRWVCCGPV